MHVWGLCLLAGDWSRATVLLRWAALWWETSNAKDAEVSTAVWKVDIPLPHPFLISLIPNPSYPLGNFDIFREVLADESLLNLPEKVDWKDCKVSNMEEIEMAQNFKEKFKKFDFTQTDDD